MSTLFKWLDNAVNNSKKKSLLFEDSVPTDTQPMTIPGQAPGGAMNDYGVERPKKHGKLFNTVRDILSVAAPAIVSATQGGGLIPGAAVGALGMLGGRANEEEAAQEQFNKDRDFRQKDAIFNADDAREAAAQKFEQGDKDRNYELNLWKAKHPNSANDQLYKDYTSALAELNELKTKGIIKTLDDIPPHLRAKLQAGAARFKDETPIVGD